MGLQKFRKNILKATHNLEFSAVLVFPDSSITLDTRMSNLDTRVSKLDIAVSVPTILVLMNIKFQFENAPNVVDKLSLDMELKSGARLRSNRMCFNTPYPENKPKRPKIDYCIAISILGKHQKKTLNIWKFWGRWEWVSGIRNVVFVHSMRDMRLTT